MTSDEHKKKMSKEHYQSKLGQPKLDADLQEAFEAGYDSCKRYFEAPAQINNIDDLNKLYDAGLELEGITRTNK